MSPSYYSDQYPPFNCFTEASISGLTVGMMLEYLAIKLNVDAALGKTFRFYIYVTDKNEQYKIELKNCVLNFRAVDRLETGVMKLTLQHFALGKIVLLAPNCATDTIACDVEGDGTLVNEFIKMFEQFGFWFNIIEA